MKNIWVYANWQGKALASALRFIMPACSVSYTANYLEAKRGAQEISPEVIDKIRAADVVIFQHLGPRAA